MDENARQIIRQGEGNPAWGSINTMQGSKRAGNNSLRLPSSGKDLITCPHLKMIRNYCSVCQVLITISDK